MPTDPAPDHALAADRRQKVIVIGASAGGVEALRRVVSVLPADLPTAILAVCHTPPGESALPQILERAGRLAAVHPEDGRQIEPGTILLAPPDRHLVVDGPRVRLERGPKINGHRPAVDPLFRTAAEVFGRRVVGVILSGALSDGTLGLQAIKLAGGRAIVQGDAPFQGMPTSAIEKVEVDQVLPLDSIGPTLVALANNRDIETAAKVPESVPRRADLDRRPDDATGLTCPECGGALWERDENGVVGFACHVGHAYSADSLDGEHAVAVERALWGAVRILDERAALLRRLAEWARAKGSNQSLVAFEERATEAERQGRLIRSRVLSAPLSDSPPGQPQ